MKVLIVMILLVIPLVAGGPARAEIYRCETPKGVVFSDRECGESAELVTLENDSAGIAIGPSDEVRERLAEQRAERAEERAARAERRANQPPPPPAPVVIERRVGYPYWWGNRPPVLRPPPERPRPPIQPPLRPDVVRPR